MRILALDAALARCSAALVADGVVVRDAVRDGPRGHDAALPVLARDVLGGDAADLVAVTIGPGSFTGIRAALAIGHGIAAGLACPIVGVTVPGALAAALPGLPPGREPWVVIHNRRGQVFLQRGLDRDAEIQTHDLEALPIPAGPIALAGDAAEAVADRLRKADIMMTGVDLPLARFVAEAALGRHHEAQPLYIEAPVARQNPLRPPPRA